MRKLCQNSKKGENERENSIRDPQTAIRKRTWIQGDSKFTSLRGLKSHPRL